MIGSDPLESVLGSRAAGDKHDLPALVRGLTKAGGHVLLIEPNGKAPLDMRTQKQRNDEDKAAQEAARDGGVVAYQKVKAPAGVGLATDVATIAVRYLTKAAKSSFGPDAVNLGLAIGPSGLVVVDADTTEQAEDFAAAWLAGTGTPLHAPTVRTPGVVDPTTGERVHYGGGHWYFRRPDGVPIAPYEAAGKWVVKVNGYVLIPPSTRTEGAYEWTGSGIVAMPDFLRKLTTPKVRDTATVARSVDSPIDAWDRATAWAEVLEPHGWTPYENDNCGCPTWTRPGNVDANARKSLTTHHSDCVKTDNGHAKVWSDSTQAEWGGASRGYSKLQVAAHLGHGGDQAAARTALGIPDDAPAIDPEDFAIGDAAAPLESTWKRIDLGAIARGNNEAQQPTIFPRSDGRSLLYPGLTHSFHGESESGKSLILQSVCVLEIKQGHHVLYLDYESDPVSVTRRLLDMGATAAEIETYFDYRLPETAPDATPGDRSAFLGLLTPDKYSLAVIDGVTASIGTFGVSSQSNDDVNAWTRKLPRAIATRTGAAVAMVDHVTKDKDSRGRYAIGAQAKMADITGAAYMVEPDKDSPVGKGIVGRIRLRIGKDRPSEVRRYCTDYRAGDHSHLVGDVIVDSTGDTLSLTLVPGVGKQLDASDATARRPKLMESISRSIEAAMADGETEWSAAAVERRVKGQAARIRASVKVLVTEGHLANNPINNRLTFVRQYREADDMEVSHEMPSGDPLAIGHEAAE